MKIDITNNYYYDTDSDAVYNSNGKALKCVDGKVKIKVDGLTKTINVNKLREKYVKQNYLDFKDDESAEKPKWLFKCNETKERFTSIEECADKYGINKHSIYLNLNGLKKQVCGYTFTYNYFTMKGMVCL